MVAPSGENATSRVAWPPTGSRGTHRFRFAARGEIAGAVGKAQDRAGTGDIDPLRFCTGRIKGDAERIVQPRRKHRFLGSRAAIGPQHADAAGSAFRDEYIAVRCGADEPRPSQAGGEQVDGKADWDERLLVAPMRDSDKVTGRFGRLRRRQIARPDETVHARPVGAPIAEGGAAFENAGGRLRKAARRRGKGRRQCSSRATDRSNGA